jgi:carboxylesterase
MAAHQNPGLIQAVNILSPTFHYDGWGMPWYYPILSHTIPLLEKFPGWQHVNFPETEEIGVKSEKMRRLMASLEAEGVLKSFPALGLKEMHHLSRAMKKAMATTTVPTLILHAREDDLAHPRNAVQMDRLHKGPHELHWIDDSYHMIHLDQYQRVVELCDKYFTRYRAPAETAAA